MTQPEDLEPPYSALSDPADLVFRFPTAEELAEGAAVVASAGGGQADEMSADEFQSRMPAQLKRYWLAGEGAAKIRWGTPGSFDRCVRQLRDEFPTNTEGLCANLYHEATGHWPGQRKD